MKVGAVAYWMKDPWESDKKGMEEQKKKREMYRENGEKEDEGQAEAQDRTQDKSLFHQL